MSKKKPRGGSVKKPGPRPLTAKMLRFIDEYLVDLNATAAAVRAGYSEKTANVLGPRLLTDERIAAAIDKAKEKRQERVEITQDYVLEVLRETVERCRQGAPVLDFFGRPVMVKTKTGEIAAAWKFDPKSVLKGCELLGQHLGMFKTVMTGPNGGPLEAVTEVRVVMVAPEAPKP